MHVPQPVNQASFSINSHKSKRTNPVLLIFMEKRCTTEPFSIRKPAANLLPRPRQESLCTTALALINKFSSTHQVPSCNLSPRYLSSASRKLCWANNLYLYSLRSKLPAYLHYEALTWAPFHLARDGTWPNISRMHKGARQI